MMTRAFAVLLLPALLPACSSGEEGGGNNAAAPAPAPTFTGAPPVTPQQQVPQASATPRWLDNAPAPADATMVHDPAGPSNETAR